MVFNNIADHKYKKKYTLRSPNCRLDSGKGIYNETSLELLKRERERERERDRQTDRQTDRQKQRENREGEVDIHGFVFPYGFPLLFNVFVALYEPVLL